MSTLQIPATDRTLRRPADRRWVAPREAIEALRMRPYWFYQMYRARICWRDGAPRVAIAAEGGGR